LPSPSFLKRRFSRAVVVATAMHAAMIGAAWAQAAKSPLAGFWQATSDDGAPSGWFYFSERNGAWEGRLVKMFKQPGETTLVTTCTACPGDKKNKPMLGLVIVYNLKRNGEGKYENGSILDPRDGKVYSASLEVTPDGQSLLLRGYLGVELFGQTQTWTRLPDTTMAAADIPGEPVGGPKPKPAAAAAKPAPKPAPAKPQSGAPDAAGTQ
jgi:uncharacterized protein (DUF2147 family)